MMKKRCFAAVLALLVCGVFPAVFAGEKAAPGAFAKIAALVRKAAHRLAHRYENRDDPRVWAFLGDCLREKGDGVGAAKYYRKAAARLPYAKFRLGGLYAAGNGVPCDKDKACELMTEALEAGYAVDSESSASDLLAMMCTPLRDYTDPKLKLHFPAQSPKFKLVLLVRPPERRLGYCLVYEGMGSEGEHTDLWVCGDGDVVVPDGLSPITEKKLKEPEEEVSLFARFEFCKNVRERTATQKGRLPLSGLDYAWYSYLYDRGGKVGWRSVTLIFGARGKSFMLRYSGAVEKDVPSEKLPTMVADLLQHLDAALKR